MCYKGCGVMTSELDHLPAPRRNMNSAQYLPAFRTGNSLRQDLGGSERGRAVPGLLPPPCTYPGACDRFVPFTQCLVMG